MACSGVVQCSAVNGSAGGGCCCGREEKTRSGEVEVKAWAFRQQSVNKRKVRQGEALTRVLKCACEEGAIESDEARLN